MIQYELKARKARFAPDEPVQLELRIANNGSAAADLPNPAGRGADPVYLITPDGAQKPERIAARDLNGVSKFIAAPAERIHIGAGGEWTGSVRIPASRVHSPGVYRVASQFQGGAAVIESNVIEIAVDRFQPSLAAAGYGIETSRAGNGQLLFLQGGTAVYKTRYVETRPSIAETRVEPPSLLEILPAEASDIGLPHRNGPFYDEMAQWVMWRQKHEVHLLSSAGERRATTVKANVTRLAQPPLKTSGGGIHVLALANNPAEVTLLLFPPGKGAAGEMAWTLPLDARADGIGATLGPAANNVEGHVAAVASTKEGALVQHVRYKDFRIPDAFNSVLLPGYRPVEGAALGMHGNGDGSGRVGLFVMSDAGLAFAELLFPVGSSGRVLSITLLGKLERAPTGSAVHYFTPAGAAEPRMAAVVATPDKGLLRLFAGALRPVSVQGQATNPILLVPGKDVTFIVYLRANGMPYLEPL
ncbi:MAG: hypothetical protein HYX27_07080 [Acidobacteria bacterium]|nr:hypothetical protein [Acidobacteriota bacterium]